MSIWPSSPATRLWGEDGYLADNGMIPMPGGERMMFSDNVKHMSNLSL